MARERTEVFLRENPVPTILGALAVGLAIGLAIRYASNSREEEIEVKSPLGSLNWSFLSLPFCGRFSNRPAKNTKNLPMPSKTAWAGCARSISIVTPNRSANAGKPGLINRRRNFCSFARLAIPSHLRAEHRSARSPNN